MFINRGVDRGTGARPRLHYTCVDEGDQRPIYGLWADMDLLA